MPAILYNHLRSKKDQTASLLKAKKLVSLPLLRNNPDCRMEAQIVNVKKGAQRVSMYTRVADKSKKFGKSYDRLLFLRDLVSGNPFAIISESRTTSIIMFHKEVKIGDYVQLYLPDHDLHEVAEVPLVGYGDVLIPLEKPTHNKLVQSVPQAVKFAVFAVEINDPKDFEIFGIGVEEVCGAKLCDGLQDDPCPCLAGTGVEKFCITAKIKVPLQGMDDCYARFRSIKFTKIFFGPNVMRNLNLCDLMKIGETVKDGIEKARKIFISGWAGYATDADDDIASAVNFHVTSVELHFAEDVHVEPNDNLPFDEDLAVNQ